jgi:hypothetical protein
MMSKDEKIFYFKWQKQLNEFFLLNPVVREFSFGGFASMIEILPVGNAIMVMKTCQQLNQPFPKKLSGYLAGLSANLWGSVPIVSLQMGIRQILKEVFQLDKQAQSSYKAETIIAFLTGVISGIAVNPPEYVATQQMIASEQESLWQTTRRLYKEKRSLWKGYWPLALREGIFCAGFMSTQPAIKQILQTPSKTISKLHFYVE